MPAVNPRVQVTLSKASFRTLAALAKRQSRSMSSIAGELLTQILPHIGAAYSLAQDLRAMGPESLAAVQELTRNLDRVNAAAVSELRDADAGRKGSPRQMDIADAIAAGGQTGPRRTRRSGPPAGSAGAARPPGTNRGV